ncbi:hypothetical protein BYT27DRAFT_7195893 [Phlegmacium glaucopus]|nr:hypothetical protein BYT27DRAFT_7195893 [Phlegmacium glaucopus]
MVALTGTNELVVGSVYIINTSGTNEVWTVEGNDIYLRPYNPNNKKQLFRATLDDANNRYGFYNDAAARRVNRNQFETIKCEKTYDTQGSWECFCEIRTLAPGRLKFFMTVNDEHRPLRKTSDGGGYYFTIQNAGSDVTFGLTKVS